MIRGLEHLLRKAERLGVIQPGDEKALRDTLLWLFSTKRRPLRKMELGCCDRTRDNSLKLKESRFTLDK